MDKATSGFHQSTQLGKRRHIFEFRHYPIITNKSDVALFATFAFEVAEIDLSPKGAESANPKFRNT
jgi:hypothetical protein